MKWVTYKMLKLCKKKVQKCLNFMVQWWSMSKLLSFFVGKSQENKWDEKNENHRIFQ